MANPRDRRASGKRNEQAKNSSSNLPVIPDTNPKKTHQPGHRTALQQEIDVNLARAKTPEVPACEQQSDEANNSPHVPWTPLPYPKKKKPESEEPTALVEEIEERSEQAVNVESMEEEHHKGDKMMLNKEGQPVWVDETPRKFIAVRKKSIEETNPGDPRDDEISDSLFTPNAITVPGIAVHRATAPDIIQTGTNLRSGNVTTDMPVPPHSFKPRTKMPFGFQKSGPRSRRNSTGEAVLEPITTNTRQIPVELRSGGPGTKDSPIPVPSDDSEESRHGQDEEGRGRSANGEHHPINSNESVDADATVLARFDAKGELFELDDDRNTGNDEVEQAKKARRDGESRVMLQHIIDMACDPRQWAHFIGRNDYNITRSKVQAKYDGHGDAGSLLLYLFHKIDDTSDKSYSQTGRTDHQDLLVTLNAPGASKAIPAPAVFQTYGGLSRLSRECSNMSFADLAKEVRELGNDIARDVQYLFLPREEVRGFITEPELDWSFVVLLVITALSQPELFEYLKAFRYSKDRHFDIYNDQLADLLLKYLRNSSKGDYYKKWEVPDMTPVWKQLREMLEEEYTIADAAADEAPHDSRSGGGHDNSGQDDQVPAMVASAQGRKRSSAHLEPERDQETPSKRGRSKKK